MLIHANPWLTRLGFAPTDSVVILHADDVGMTHETFGALDDWLDARLTFSASVMVPCPWFRGTVDFCRANPTLDMGVHLTLNAEWPNYRWRPVSTTDPRTGLFDGDGFLWNNVPDAMRHIQAGAGIREMAAQVRMAQETGIDVSHLDVHMGTPFHPKFFAGYVGLALRHRLPVFLPRMSEANLRRLSAGPLVAKAATRLLLPALERRLPVFDGMAGMPLDNRERGVAEAARHLEALGPGLWHFFLHPAQDSPALRAMCPHWRSRVCDWKTFASPAFRRWSRRSGIRFLRYADLRRLISR